MTRKAVCTALIVFVQALPVVSWAAPKLEVSIVAEQEVAVSESGVMRTERVPARNIQPGDEIIYTITYSNTGDETASNIVIEDPIPANSIYIADSYVAPGAETTFSGDGGNSFAIPGEVMYEVRTAAGVQELMAEPSKYTHIRWVLDEVGVGESGHASFRVRVKGSPDNRLVLEQAPDTELEPEAPPAVSPLTMEPEAEAAVSPLTGEPQMFVQVGAFSMIDNAMQLRSELAGLFPSAHIASSSWKERLLYRVRIGPFEDTRQIENTVIELHRHGQDAVIMTE